MAAGVVPLCIKINIPADGDATNAVRAVSSATTGSLGGTANSTAELLIVNLVASVPELLVTLNAILDGIVAALTAPST